MKEIKIAIKGHLKSINDNEKSVIDVIAIKKDNKIQYILDDVIHKIEIDNNKVTLVRENDEFKNILEFIKGKKNKSYYLLKEKNFCVDINIETIELEYKDNYIEILYEVLDSKERYEYKLEMRNIDEYKK